MVYTKADLIVWNLPLSEDPCINDYLNTINHNIHHLIDKTIYI